MVSISPFLDKCFLIFPHSQNKNPVTLTTLLACMASLWALSHSGTSFHFPGHGYFAHRWAPHPIWIRDRRAQNFCLFVVGRLCSILWARTWGSIKHFWLLSCHCRDQKYSQIKNRAKRWEKLGPGDIFKALNVQMRLPLDFQPWLNKLCLLSKPAWVGVSVICNLEPSVMWRHSACFYFTHLVWQENRSLHRKRHTKVGDGVSEGT